MDSTPTKIPLRYNLWRVHVHKLIYPQSIYNTCTTCILVQVRSCNGFYHEYGESGSIRGHTHVLLMYTQKSDWLVTPSSHRSTPSLLPRKRETIPVVLPWGRAPLGTQTSTISWRPAALRKSRSGFMPLRRF